MSRNKAVNGWACSALLSSGMTKVNRACVVFPAIRTFKLSQIWVTDPDTAVTDVTPCVDLSPGILTCTMIALERVDDMSTVTVTVPPSATRSGDTVRVIERPVALVLLMNRAVGNFEPS